MCCINRTRKTSSKGENNSTNSTPVGNPDFFRPIGKAIEVYDDGSRLVNLSRPPHGPYGFYVGTNDAKPGNTTLHTVIVIIDADDESSIFPREIPVFLLPKSGAKTHYSFSNLLLWLIGQAEILLSSNTSKS